MMRFALVGCGVIAPTHVRALQQLAERAELVYCCDTDPANAQALAAEFGLQVADYADVLVDPSIDAITVCAPSGSHADVGVPALEAGKHVVVEKPMDITTEACDRLLEAQARTGTTLAVISQHRFDAASQLVKKTIDDGDLGQLIMAECRVPWYRAQEYYDSAGWRGTWDHDGGGSLMNQGVHTLDLMRWTCGPVASVYAQMRTAGHERIEVEDLVAATVVFANDALATVVASTSLYPGYPARLAVHGTKGGAVIEGDRLAALDIIGREPIRGEEANAHARQVASGGTRAATKAVDEAVADDPGRTSDAGIEPEPDAWGEAHRRQLLDFIEASEGGHRPLVDGQAGRDSVELVRAIYQSARTGEVVNL